MSMAELLSGWGRRELEGRVVTALPPGPQIPTWAITYQWIRRPFPFLEECANRFGDTFTLQFSGLPPLVIFSHPEDVKEIFADDGNLLHAGEFNKSLSAFLGENSVLMLDGREHLRHRRLLLPPFHGERMQHYAQSMIDETHRAVDEWKVGEPFSLHPWTQRITLRVILETVFGFGEGEKRTRIEQLIKELLDIAAWPPMLLPFMQVDLGPLSPWGKWLRKSAVADRILLDEIAERRRAGDSRRNDVLSLLLAARDEAGQPMTDEELRDELITLLVAGHETTATALTWATRWILDSPDVERRLRDELTAAAPLTPEKIGKLELLDAVVRESLRLNPVIPIVGRILKKPARVGRFDLPAGVGVLCSIYLAQRRPSLYPNPELFDPDRFSRKKFSPNELFPFGGGIRRCIGMAFALYEMKMVLATMLSRTHLRLASRKPIRVVRRSITLAPSEGLRIRVVSKAGDVFQESLATLGTNVRSISA
jgi:cytochrome P450